MRRSSSVLAAAAGLLAIVPALLTSCTAAAAAAPPRIGMNLEGPSFYAKSYPFLDRMKTASWNVLGSPSEPLVLDAKGYPVAIPAGGTQIALLISVDPQSLPTTDRYILTWEGAGSIGVLRGRVVSQSRGKAVIEAQEGDQETFLDIRFGDFSPADPLRNMHMVREDQAARLAAGEIFNPYFLDRLRPFDTIRFMDWARTNSATWTPPATTEDRASWAMSGDAVPLSVQVRLANELGRNFWYNAPFGASDAVIAAQIRYLKANLKPNLKLYAEWANEVWNWSFPATGLAAEAGKPLKLDAFMYHGYRAAQVAKVVRDAWGADPDKRLRNVLATQTGWQGQEQWHILPGAAAAKVGDPAKLFDAYAVTTYFYGKLDPQQAATWQRTVAQARGGEAGLTAFLADLETVALPVVEKDLAYQARVAKAHGWELIAYEGGQHLTVNPGAPADEGAAVGQMIGRALEDPRMGVIYGKMVDSFARQGGTLLTAFNDAGPLWGVLPTTYATGSPRYNALVAAAKSGGSEAADGG